MVTINPDRPTVAESSMVVPKGTLLSENGLQLTDTAGAYVLDLPESSVRYGLLEKTELRLTVPDYFYSLPGNASPSGFGDMAIGVKQQLGPVRGIDVSLVAYLTLPTGAEAISSHGYDPALQLPWSRSLSALWTVGGQFATYWPTVSGTHNFTGEATVYLDRQLRAPWDVFLEYVGDFPERGGSSELLHVGTTYKLTPLEQLDCHAAVGLTQAAPTWYIGFGYSYLFAGH